MAITTLDGGGKSKTLKSTEVSSEHILHRIIEPMTLQETGERDVTNSAVQAPTVTAKLIRIRAKISNVGNIYYGKSGVTVPDGTQDATSGIPLMPGEDSGFLPAENLDELYVIGDEASGDDYHYEVWA